MRHFRAPVKFFLLSTLGLSLLAAVGLDRAWRERLRAPLLSAVPGLLLLAAGLAIGRWPNLPARLLGQWIPQLHGPHAAFVVRKAWPQAFTVSGALGLGAGLALSAGPRLAPLSGLLACLDLLIVNTAINPTVPAAFYEPHPELARLLNLARSEQPYRWFSYGVANSPRLQWSPWLAVQNSDMWLYYMERQALLPRSHVLDGLEAAFDEELGLWAPPGSALPTAERTPSRYREHHRRLRLANVRWVLSFQDLPEVLVSLRGEARFPQLVQPLRLYEIKDPLPRAFWVGGREVIADGPRIRARIEEPDFDPRRVVIVPGQPPDGPPPAPVGGEGSVRFERPDPHTVRLTTSGPPGQVVVLEGYHRDWRVEGVGGAVQLQQAYGRYWALTTPGGEQVFTLRYVPSWRTPALVLSVTGGLVCLGLGLRRAPRSRAGAGLAYFSFVGP
jgi:hypothetical protein